MNVINKRLCILLLLLFYKIRRMLLFVFYTCADDRTKKSYNHIRLRRVKVYFQLCKLPYTLIWQFVRGKKTEARDSTSILYVWHIFQIIKQLFIVQCAKNNTFKDKYTQLLKFRLPTDVLFMFHWFASSYSTV